MTMLAEKIPADIQNMIINIVGERKPDEELLKILPPENIRKELLAERGVIQVVPRQRLSKDDVRDWLDAQYQAQTEAKKLLADLMAAEPMTTDVTKTLNIPLWSVSGWADLLFFDWSAKLPEAVESAKAYLNKAK